MNDRQAGLSSNLALAISSNVVKRSTMVAVVVGTILATINHADALIAGTFSLPNALKVGLTYLVPYGVATYSAVSALTDNAQPATKKTP